MFEASRWHRTWFRAWSTLMILIGMAGSAAAATQDPIHKVCTKTIDQDVLLPGEPLGSVEEVHVLYVNTTVLEALPDFTRCDDDIVTKGRGSV